jgi:hypothetical protein
VSSTVRPESAEGEGKAAKISKNGDRPSVGELLAQVALAEDGERLRKALASSSEDQATGPIGKEALA